jgi:hypothetical protein
MRRYIGIISTCGLITFCLVIFLNRTIPLRPTFCSNPGRLTADESVGCGAERTFTHIPEPNEIIENNAKIVEEIKHRFEGQSLAIVAKGPTAKYVRHAVGINQAVMLTDRTFLFMNDFASFLGIEDIMPEIKYIFLPDYPHSPDAAHFSRPNKEKDYRVACRMYTNLGFTGKFYVYQIQTTFNAHEDDIFFNSDSSTDIPIQFFSRHFNVSSIHTYGYKRGSGYHPFIEVIKANVEGAEHSEEIALLARRVIREWEQTGIGYLSAKENVSSTFDPEGKAHIHIH